MFFGNYQFHESNYAILHMQKGAIASIVMSNIMAGRVDALTLTATCIGVCSCPFCVKGEEHGRKQESEYRAFQEKDR